MPSWRRRSCLSWRRRGAGHSERKQRLTRRKVFSLELSSSNYFHLPETVQVWLLERSNSQSSDSTNSVTLVRLCATVQLSRDSFQKPGGDSQHPRGYFLTHLNDLRPLNYTTLRLATRSAFWEEIYSNCITQLCPDTLSTSAGDGVRLSARRPRCSLLRRAPASFLCPARLRPGHLNAALGSSPFTPLLHWREKLHRCSFLLFKWQVWFQ